MRIELVYKKIEDTNNGDLSRTPHVRSKNAALDAVGDDSFLAWLLLNSNDDPLWSVASTNTSPPTHPSTSGRSETP